MLISIASRKMIFFDFCPIEESLADFSQMIMRFISRSYDAIAFAVEAAPVNTWLGSLHDAVMMK